MRKGEDSVLKILALSLGVSVAFYILFFGWVEHRRSFKGPWIVKYSSDASGRPALLVSQPALGIDETLAFPDARVAPNLDDSIQFAEATSNAPFGSVIFQDPTFLPGTLTLGLFGHEVEFLPRVMIIDKQERPWTPGGRIELRH